MKVVVHPLEEATSQIHVSNWVNRLLEYNASWDLAISMTPMMLNSFQVPLVNNCYYSLAFTLIDSLEKILISLVYKYLLDFREEHIE